MVEAKLKVFAEALAVERKGVLLTYYFLTEDADRKNIGKANFR